MRTSRHHINGAPRDGDQWAVWLTQSRFQLERDYGSDSPTASFDLRAVLARAQVADRLVVMRVKEPRATDILGMQQLIWNGDALTSVATSDIVGIPTVHALNNEVVGLFRQATS